MQSTSFGRWLAGVVLILFSATSVFSPRPARADIGLPPLNPIYSA